MNDLKTQSLEQRAKSKYTWYYIDACCESLARRIRGNGDNITHIVGVSRGGLIPATLLAKHLDVREVISFGLKSYNDGDDYETRVPTPEVYQGIDQCYQLAGADSNVLIVDDITDKGNTFKYIEKMLAEKLPTASYRTVSIFRKQSSEYHPDYFATNSLDDEWVVFPWEKE